MTRTSIEASLNDLNFLIATGKAEEAFEKYYSENVVMQENELTPTIGKDANRKRETEFKNNISAFRKAEVLAMAVGDNISYVTWRLDYTHRYWGERNYTQVAVQRWDDGKIINEQFFYGN